LGDKIKEDKRSEACSTYGIEEICTRPSVVIAGEKESLGRYKHRWEDNVKTDVKEIHERK
jgi:hypothetical protein